MSKIKVYLDNNASTELSNDVVGSVMDIILNDVYSNPSSSHSSASKIKGFIHSSRSLVAQSLGCSEKEILFTSGGTESNNLAIRGSFIQDYSDPQVVVISAGEHSSVRETSISSAGRDNVRIIPLLPDGSLDLDWVDRLISEDVSLISVMLANNETGVIYPVKEIAQIAHSRGVLVHCDAVQGYGKIPIDVYDLGVDLLSISGHKAHALPGVGALYIRRGLLMYPQITGGYQEGGLRSGTENYIGIISLGTAAQEIHVENSYVKPALRDLFERAILKRIPNVVINGSEVSRVPNTSSVTFKGVHSAGLLAMLDQRGVLASAGSACSSGLNSPSVVLKSMGLSDEDALSTVRFSFSKLTTIEQTAAAIEAVVGCVSVLRENLLTSG